jgi:tetratricopeptide (TPR) repeat protein
MRTREVIGSFCVLFVGLLSLFPQSTANRQQQVHSHSVQAQAFLKQSRPDLAIPEFRAIVALDRNNADALGNLGVLLFFHGDYADAISPLRAALKLQPSLWKIEALLGMAERRTGDNAKARIDLAKSFPEIPEEKIKIEAGLELIELYSGTGELDKAAVVIDRLVALYPTNPQVQFTSYRIHSDVAAQAMLSLSIVAPKSALMHQVIAHELAKQGERDGAIRNYREALEIDPKLPGLHFELAEMLKASGSKEEQDEAKREYEAALALNKFDEKSECKLGEIAYRDRDLDQSFAHYSRAVQIEPDDVDADVGLAKVLVEMNQPQKARPLLEHAVSVDSTNPVAHYRLGLLYRQQGLTSDAKQQLEEYKKYKKMKEKLNNIYHEMRLQPSKPEQDETEVQK